MNAPNPPAAFEGGEAEPHSSAPPLYPTRFRLLSPWRALVERRRWVAVVGAAFSVLILLLTSTVPLSALLGSSGVQTDSSPVPPTNDSTLTLAFANTSLFPSPSALPSAAGNLSLPKLVMLPAAPEAVEGLLYVLNDSSGHHLLQFQTGEYDPSLAQAVLQGLGCPQACPPTLPIHWNAPATIFDFGLEPVASDSVSASGGEVAVAASAGNDTWVWLAGQNYGPGDWQPMNETNYRLPIQGGDGRLAISGCTIVLTTGAPGTIRVTTFRLLCQGHAILGEGQRRGPLLPPPVVTEVAPDCGPLNTAVTIYGLNFLSGASAHFGNTVVPTQYISSTQLTATVPSGSGMVDVLVSQSSGESSPNPPADQWTWSNGAQPCVWSLSPTAGIPGRSVTVNGYGFTPGATVEFGNSAAPTTFVNSGQLMTVVPVGCGSGPVTVISSGFVSPIWAGSLFTITATWPTVTSLYPYSGGSGTQVTINGTAFDCAGATVKFGSNTGTGVTVLSYSQLKATAPSGSGTVDVTVTENGHTSNTSSADQFSYTPGAIPAVSSLNVTSGTIRTAVTITGSNFDRYATVKFGSVSATSVHYVSSTTLTAVAPLTYGIVNVTVTVNHLTSATSSADLFAYPNPVVGEVYPDYGSAGDVVLISGASIAPDSTVLFGTTRATSVTHLSPQAVDATVPAGSGTVQVIIVQNGTANAPSLMSRFSYQRYAPFSGHFMNFTSVSVTLPAAGDAQPALWQDPATGLEFEGVLASDSASGAILFYAENNTTGLWFHSHSVTGFGRSTGSPIFTSVGGTRLLVSGGTPGQVTLAQEGTEMFIGFTSRVDDRVAIQTALSKDGGRTWNVTYTATASMGVIEDPQIVTSPAGPFFATWRDDGAGGWEVDVAVFSDSGHLTVGSTAVVGSGGPSLTNATSPTIAVDEWERPLVAWASSGGAGSHSRVRFTGGFVSPATIAQWMDTAFHSLTPSDFYPVLNLTGWRAQQNTSVDQLLLDLQQAQWCPAETVLFKLVYPNVTQSFVYPYLNATPPLCPGAPSIHYWPTEVVPTVGPGSPGTVFSVEEEWLDEALGYGIVAPPSWMGAPGGPPITAPPPPSGLHVNSPGHTADHSNDLLSVAPLTVNPNTVLLNATAGFNSPFTTTNSSCGGGAGLITSTVTDAPANYTLYATETFSGSLLGPETPPVGTYLAVSPVVTALYLTNLTGQAWGTWTESVAAHYQATLDYKDGCVGNETTRPVPIPSGMPSFVNLTVNGAWSTELGFLPQAPPLLVTNGQNVTTTQWNNSMLATANITTNLTTGGLANTVDHQSAKGYRIAEKVTLGNVTISPGATYSTTFQLRSTNGGTDYANWTPRINALQSGFGYPNVSTTATCSFNMSTNPVLLYWDRNNITNITNTSVDLTWYASGSGNGEVVYWESYGPAEEQSAYDQTGVNYHGYSDRYTVELHDLIPWGSYTVEILQKKQDGGCHVFQNGAIWHINTTRTFKLWEEDAPFDSVSQLGGGALVSWDVPLALLDASGVSFVSGQVSLTNVSNTSDVYSYSLASVPYEPSPGTFQLNLTSLQRNQTYSVSMRLNYTYGTTTLSGTSYPFRFTYLKGTSGDGLTDWEKLRGWQVTSQNSTGIYASDWVRANPSDWATNGLVNDFAEKEFGLNPRTVDSAGSHMLDTWNLTFDLGSNSSNPSIPSGGNFETWSELGHYDWTRSCPYFGAPKCSGFVIGTDWSNLSDSAPWASEVLWSRTALTKFINMSGVQNASWLRGMLGTSGTERTLTVWGKLSWGANPLAASTPQNGIPDGYRVSPLGGTDVQVRVTGWSDHGLQSGNGVAAFIEANSATAPYYSSPSEVYANYTYQTSAGSGGTTRYSGTFTATFPVVPTEQSTQLNLTLVENVGVNGNNRYQAGLESGSVSVDLLNTTVITHTFTNSTKSSLTVSWQAIPVSTKAPTYIVVPGGNSTLSSLPWGLKRYVGEQDFVLLVINDTVAGTGPTKSGLYFPGNTSGTYAASLQSGLNNVLIPRSALVASPLGQALLNGTNQTITSTAKDSGLQPYWTPNEWYARVTGTTWGGYNYSPPSTGYIRVYSSSTQGCSQTRLCGTIPSEPALEQGHEDLAVGAILTLNISSESDWNNTLAGVLLNTSGSFSNWLLSATSVLPTLGLTPAVTTALGNETLPNDGGFGAPTSTTTVQQSSPEPWYNVLGTEIWNGASGVGNWFANEFGGGFSVAWNYATAAGTFFTDLPGVIGNWLLHGISKLPGDLKTIWGDILGGSQWVAQQIVTAVASVIQQVISVVKQGIQSYLNSIATYSVYLLGNFTSGSFSLSSMVLAYSNLMLSIVGLGPYLSDLTSALNQVGSLLSACQSIVGTNALMVAISTAMGAAIGPSAASAIEGGLPSVTAFSLETVSNSLLWTLSQLGSPHSTTSYATGSPHPSSSQMNGAVSTLTSDSGQPNYGSSFGNDFTSWTSSTPETILDGAHIGLTIAVILSTLFEAVGETWDKVAISFQNMVVPYAQEIEATKDNPEGVIAFEILGCVLGLASLWLPSPPSDSVINEVLAISGAFMAGVAFAIGTPYDADPIVAIIEAVALGVACIVPIWVWFNG